MMNINNLTFLSLLWATMFFTSCNGQVKKNLSKESAAISTGQPKLIKTHGSDPGNNVHCSLQDKKGDLWFGTEGGGDVLKGGAEGGVWRYDGKTFKNFSKKEGLSNNSVWSILEDKAGNFWVRTRNTGLYRFDGKTFTSFSA